MKHSLKTNLFYVAIIFLQRFQQIKHLHNTTHFGYLIHYQALILISTL